MWLKFVMLVQVRRKKCKVPPLLYQVQCFLHVLPYKTVHDEIFGFQRLRIPQDFAQVSSGNGVIQEGSYALDFTHVCTAITYSKGNINRVRLPILLVVS